MSAELTTAVSTRFYDKQTVSHYCYATQTVSLSLQTRKELDWQGVLCTCTHGQFACFTNISLLFVSTMHCVAISGSKSCARILSRRHRIARWHGMGDWLPISSRQYRPRCYEVFDTKKYDRYRLLRVSEAQGKHDSTPNESF